MGQWIGGDRDGNPNVTAETLALALRRQAEVALRHYLTEVHYLGGELSLSARLVESRPRCRPWPMRRPTTMCTAGRALSPRADRHLCAPGRHAAADGRRGRAPRVAPQNPMHAEEFLADLRIIDDSLRAPRRGPGAQRLRR
jgi:phosphoenolpyruvate carboxylase